MVLKQIAMFCGASLFVSLLESCNRFRLELPAIRVAHAHASQADSGNVEFSEASRLQSDLLL
jgi:hypothetical protein